MSLPKRDRGGNEDVLGTSGVGTELFNGAYVTPNTFRFLGVYRRCWGAPSRRMTPNRGRPPVFVS